MGLFKDIAMPLVTRSVPVIPLRPKTKIAFLSNWQEIATTDLKKVEEWDEEFPDANGACVAKPDGVWFLEIDKEGFAKHIEAMTGQRLPETLMVRSSPGRGHFYFKQTAESVKMGNRKATDAEGKELWSARVNNAYVVAPGSFHPTSGRRYEVIRDTEIVPAPDWLVQWCCSQTGSDPQSKTGHAELDDESPIASGSRNNSITSILGKARQVLGMDKEQLYEYGLSVNRKRCNPPLSDAEIRTIANSVGRYEIKESPIPFIGGVPAGTASVKPQAQVEQNIIELPVIKAVPYPVFPRWVMKGTSLYDGLVEPICAKNSRYPEYMFMPGVAIMLNYLATKVRIEYKNLIPSWFMVCIGRKGRVIKSSSMNDTIEYLHYAGIVDSASSATRNAEGKSLTFTPGSAEGLGLEMLRTNCKNAILVYDELSTLTSKAGIDGSSLGQALLTIAESGKFSNTIKGRKESYHFDAGTYCASLIACTTDRNFHQHWSKLAGESSGLDERFFFLYQPETLIPLTPQVYVDTREAALATSKRISKAVQQGIYRITDNTPLEEKINKLGNRVEGRAEKLALYFAVDLGRDEIDEECIERALAICDYELSVKKYLKTFESTTAEGMLQNEVIQLLQRNGGKVTERELNRSMHPERHGTTLWFKVYSGLIRNGWTIETGTGTKGDPKMLILMRVPEEEDE